MATALRKEIAVLWAVAQVTALVPTLRSGCVALFACPPPNTDARTAATIRKDSANEPT